MGSQMGRSRLFFLVNFFLITQNASGYAARYPLFIAIIRSQIQTTLYLDIRIA